ncbi:hypothetical protein [Nonomuraea phyllanthi]|uniref:hypothetical protein n=1 Tax=Nonomuraea phyllanthi TaxID=2219224 RepID=UPI00186B579C|nr:hypothetical protein [Nonomuraea phyllanthi]
MAISVRAIGPRDLPAVTRVLTGSRGGSTVVALGRGAGTALLGAVRAAGVASGELLL